MALGNVTGIVLKHSMVPNDKPDPAELKPGEVALNANSASMTLYALDEAGTVQQISGGGGGGTVQVDGDTIVHDPTTQELKVGTVDTGTF